MLSGMSQKPQGVSEEPRQDAAFVAEEEQEYSNESDLSALPKLPPGIVMPAPSKTPRRRTWWPDAIDVIFEKDPACKNVFEALLYPGLWAVFYHYIAHALYKLYIPFLPRLISLLARFLTGGIEIHPGGRISKPFFIPRNAGVVIGDTTLVVPNVISYH